MKIFEFKTGEKLPFSRKLRIENGELRINYTLSKLKTFNQKIQWIKLYGVTDLMRNCTDKVKVRDYVRERLEESYLKPVLQVISRHCEGISRHCARTTTIQCPQSNPFDEINWDSLPTSFVIKCNHGCKWQSIVKDKNEILNNKNLKEACKRQINGWLEQEFWCWHGFELQYKGIEPKILIEPYMPSSRYLPPYQPEDGTGFPISRDSLPAATQITVLFVWLNNEYARHSKLFSLIIS